MVNLIPHFIHDQYRAGQESGQFQAVTLFLDIAGFAAMTRTLMDHGPQGAESMASIINRVFEPLIDAVYNRSGFITTFAGDAFTAVFPYPAHEPAPTVQRALQAIQAIQQIFATQAEAATPFGQFPLAVRQGMAAGLVEWAIIGPPDHKGYYFRGPGIDGCTAAEHRAQPGEIILAPQIQALLPDGLVRLEPAAKGYARLPLQGAPPPAAAAAIPDLEPETSASFLPQSLLPPPAQGEFRDVVSLFINIDKETTAAQLEQFVSQVIGLADRLGGFFNKLDFNDQGGTILVLFGAPTAHESDLQRALNLALSLPESGEVRWRAGLHQGMAYTGLLGSVSRSEYTALGSAVNLAARLMMQAEWGQALVSAEISIREAFAFEHLGDFNYKGFTRPLPTYRLAGRRSVAERVFAQPLVERQQELASLLQAAQPIFEPIAGRRSGLAIIHGEAGIGKSRLSYELRKALPEGATWITGQADQILRQPLNPFVYFLRRYFGQSADNRLQENWQQFNQALQELLDSLQQSSETIDEDGRLALRFELQRTRSVLAALVGLRQSDSLYEKMDAKGRYQNSLLAVKALLLAESCRRPLVLEMEDAHWFDEASHEALTVLTRNIGEYPLFIILTARYQDDGSAVNFQLAPEMPAEVIELANLSANALRSLAEGILQGPISPTLEQTLQAKAQANPFFAQQILYYFNENRLIARDKNGRWQLQDESFRLPGSINAILVARIDRLAGRVREVVKAAAVLGREFEVRILAQILRHDIQTDVQAAAQEQIWTMLGDLQYIFKHALLRDAAYNMQLGTRLRQLHLLAAEAYERVYNDDLSSYYADLAYHYGLAEKPEQEGRYARLAGEQAAARYANSEALRFFSRALELAGQDDISARYELLLAREKIYDLQGEREAHGRDLEELQQISRRLDDPLRQATVLLRRSRYAELTSDYNAATDAAREAMEVVRPLAKANPEAAALVTQGQIALGTALMRRSSYAKAQQELEQALPALDQGEAGEHLALLCIVLGGVCYYQGQYDSALDYWQRALPIYREIGNIRGQGATLNNLGLITCDLGDYDDAQDHYRQSLALKQEIGDQYGQGITLGNLGAVFHTLGNYQEAQSHYQRSLVIKREIGDRYGEGETLSDLAAVAHDLGSLQQAEDYLWQALEISLDIGDRHVEGRARHYLGMVMLDQGEGVKAAEYLQQALALRRELNQPQYAVEDLAGLARWALANDDHDQAVAYIDEILAYQAENASLDGAIYPFRIFLTCYEVLRRTADPRADEILTLAYRLLQQRLVKISDPRLRQAFLSGNIDHRALHDAWLRKNG